MGRRLSELAELVGGRVEGDSSRVIDGLATLEEAGESELSFVIPGYRERAAASRAGAFLVGENVRGLERDLLVAREPRHALAILIDHFHPPGERQAPGVHPTAVVDPTATVDPGAAVGAYSVVGAGSTVASGAVLHPHVVVGASCRIDEDATLHPHVVLYDRTEIGARSIVHSGVVLGSDGYGYASRGAEHSKLRHVGRTVVEADVEIGANCTIDRALLAETRIGEGTKIDNLVQVGHNVRLGRGCLLVSQVGVSGSTVLGTGVVMAGQSGVAGHLELGDGSRVSAKSAAFKSVPAGSTVAGIPAVETARWRRSQALIGRLDELRRRVRALERELAEQEEE